MILKSLIKDDSKLTFECLRTTLLKGSAIKVPDHLLSHGEIQGAIRAGFVELVDENADKKEQSKFIKTARCTNTYSNSLSFEKLRISVMPQSTFEIPCYQLEDAELINAIKNGWIKVEEVEKSLERKQEEPKKEPEKKIVTIVEEILVDNKKPRLDPYVPNSKRNKQPRRLPKKIKVTKTIIQN